MRIASHSRLQQELRLDTPRGMQVLVLEPEPTDTLLFLHNPANLAARRAILEYAYRTTRDRISLWIERHRPVVEQLGWRAASGGEAP